MVAEGLAVRQKRWLSSEAVTAPIGRLISEGGLGDFFEPKGIEHY
jgi:hypothetical protein